MIDTVQAIAQTNVNTTLIISVAVVSVMILSFVFTLICFND